MLKLIENDPWLEPYEAAIQGRYDYYVRRKNELTDNGAKKLKDVAKGYEYYGLHKTKKGWTFREWAPNATQIYLIGDFTEWQEKKEYKLTRLNGHGDWEVNLPADAIKHEDYYKLKVYWEGGSGERIPA